MVGNTLLSLFICVPVILCSLSLRASSSHSIPCSLGPSFCREASSVFIRLSHYPLVYSCSSNSRSAQFDCTRMHILRLHQYFPPAHVRYQIQGVEEYYFRNLRVALRDRRTNSDGFSPPMNAKPHHRTGLFIHKYASVTFHC